MRHKVLPTKPELYHGIKDNRPYFEGWYFKHVSDDLTIAIICGMSRSKNQEDDHSFVQIIRDKPYKSYYMQFGYDKFIAKKDSFEVSIGENFLSYDRLKINIDTEDIKINVDLKYQDHKYLEVSKLSPSIMGPYSYIPNMQCNHGVLSLKNTVLGTISIDDKTYSMDNAIGYIEKDWGESFPRSWVWLQGNKTNKKEEDVTFMCSVASIPFGILNFRGLIATLTINDKQFRFATYNKAKIKSIDELENSVRIIIKKRNYMLYINAFTNKFEELIAPTRSGMDRKIYESLSAEIMIRLTYKDETIYKGVLVNCGMEISELYKLAK